MKHKLFSMLLLLLFAGSMVQAQSDASDFSLIMERIQTSEWEKVSDVTALDATVANLQSTLQADGSWTDINYSSAAQTDWPPIAHLNRVKNMALAYTLDGSTYKNDATLYAKIIAALQAWQDKDPRSTNWYNQQIVSPQRVGIILILMRAGEKQEHQTLETAMLNRMASIGGRPDQSGSQGTGANKIDIATHWVYRACLTENATDLSFGTTQVYMPIEFTTGEGLQNDFSYQQHGPQFYTGGYGLSYISAVANMAVYTRGTPYALSGDKLNIISGFTQEYLRIIRGKYFLYNVLGRGYSRTGGLNQSSFVNTLKQVKIFDPDNAAIYDAATARLNTSQPASYNVPKKHTHYFRSDYTLYTAPEYTFDVRTVSNRTYRSENGNSEGLKGYFLADGATSITIDGDEYLEIFPTWDWAKIPGTTTPQRSSIPQPAQWGTYGKSAFAGGVSDSIYGVTAFDYYDTDYSINTSAKKSYFFFGNEIVCLGANIKSTATETINTTINQTLLKGDVAVSSANAETTLPLGDHPVNNADWVYHNKVGYVFPEGGNLKLSNKEQSGTWTSINTSQAAGTVTKDVFTLWIDHGVQPTNANYAYIVVPNTDVAALRSYDKNNIEILVNSDTVQAVRHKSLNVTGLVFYKAATYATGDFTLKANKGCAILLRDETTANVKVQIADPSQNNTNIKLRFVSTALPTEKELVFTTPVAPYRGSSAALTINSETPDYVEGAIEPTPDNVLVASADTYVDGGKSTTNFNDLEKLLVQYSYSASYTRRAYLQFDVTDAVRNAGYQSVKLRLVAQASLQSSKTGDHHIEVRTVPANLPAIETMTWSANSESTTAKGDAITTSPIVLTHEAFQPGTVYEIDVANYVLQHLSDNSIRLMISGLSSGKDGNVYFHSLEGVDAENRPMLIFESPALGILNPSSQAVLHIAGNPVQCGKNAVLLYSAAASGNATISVYDVYGRTLSQREVTLTGSDNRIVLETAQFNAGLYFVSVNGGNTVKMLIK